MIVSVPPDRTQPSPPAQKAVRVTAHRPRTDVSGNEIGQESPDGLHWHSVRINHQAGLAVGIWFAIGVLYLVYLAAKHPTRVHNMEEVFD